MPRDVLVLLTMQKSPRSSHIDIVFIELKQDVLFEI